MEGKYDRTQNDDDSEGSLPPLADSSSEADGNPPVYTYDDDEAYVLSEGIHTSKSKSIIFRNGLSVIIKRGFQQPIYKNYL